MISKVDVGVVYPGVRECTRLIVVAGRGRRTIVTIVLGVAIMGSVVRQLGITIILIKK
jgi:hypothetical protein